jgi:hypothetical protein
MVFSGAIFFFCWLLSMGFIGAGWVMAYRLAPAHRRVQHTRWLVGWSIKGLAVPFLLWAIMNFGVSWSLPPFMPQVQAAQNAGSGWFLQFLAVVAAGLFLISSYWAAATLGWALFQSYHWLGRESQADFKSLCKTWLIGMSIPAILLAVLGGWWTFGLAAFVLMAPMGGSAPRILAPMKMPPMYARAIARIKFGKYNEAEMAIIQELEKREDDFQGWMMLAELYANHFNDLPEAERTVLEICDHPKTTPSQLALVLNRLADWHLKIAGDPDAARRALHMLSDRLRGTHLARMAQLRMNQLPATAQALREERIAKPIPLPALGDHFDDTPPPPQSQADRAKAAEAATACVEKLKQDPNNVAAREKLARLLAEQLHQATQGIEQLMLLLDVPGQDDARRAEWWGLIAAWQLKYRQDVAEGRRVLERIIREFPQSPQALSAKRRLQLMDQA